MVDKKITTARDLITILEEDIHGGYPIFIITGEIKQKAFATIVVRKLRGALKVLDGIAILIGGIFQV